MYMLCTLFRVDRPISSSCRFVASPTGPDRELHHHIGQWKKFRSIPKSILNCLSFAGIRYRSQHRQFTTTTSGRRSTEFYSCVMAKQMGQQSVSARSPSSDGQMPNGNSPLATSRSMAKPVFWSVQSPSNHSECVRGSLTVAVNHTKNFFVSIPFTPLDTMCNMTPNKPKISFVSSKNFFIVYKQSNSFRACEPFVRTTNVTCLSIYVRIP